jgi:hypothetical protein
VRPERMLWGRDPTVDQPWRQMDFSDPRMSVESLQTSKRPLTHSLIHYYSSKLKASVYDECFTKEASHAAFRLGVLERHRSYLASLLPITESRLVKHARRVLGHSVASGLSPANKLWNPRPPERGDSMWSNQKWSEDYAVPTFLVTADTHFHVHHHATAVKTVPTSR